MFEFKITLNDEDYLLFNEYHLLNSPSCKKALIFYKLFIPFFCFMVICIFGMADADFQLILIEAIAMLLLSIFWIVCSKKQFLKSMKKRIIKMKKDGRLPYSNESILKFDGESMYEITPETESKTKYSLIEKIAVTEKAIYIYISSAQAYIIPITAFTDETEKLRFLEFVNSKTGVLSDTK